MSRGDPWFKFYPSDWLTGTRELTLEQRGAYIDSIAMQMQYGKAMPDDYSWLAHQMHVSTRKARAIVDELIALKKLSRTDAGITNERCEQELSAREHQRKVNTRTAAVRERTKRESTLSQRRTNDEPALNQSPVKCEELEFINQINECYALSCNENSTTRARLDTDTDKEKNITPLVPLPPTAAKAASVAVATPPPIEALKAFQSYNDLAQRIGIPMARTLTPSRRKILCARLREHGIESWQVALANIEKSAFLRGNNNRGWRADFDFVIRSASYAKLVDGVYGNGAHGDVLKPAETQAERMARVVRELEQEGRL